MLISPVGPAINPEAAAPLAPLTRPEAEDGPASSSGSGNTTSGGTGSTFASLLRDVLQHEAAAQRGVDDYAVGATQNLHETMIALEKADISLSLLVNVRNKLLDAYREVMRMS